MNDLKLTYMPIEALIPSAHNARTHSSEQVKQLAKSIKEFGFLIPVLVDADNRLIAGHARLLAAKKLGLPQVPVVSAQHLTETQRRAYMLADNQIALNAGWDNELLRVELKYLLKMDFDVDLTGFSTPEVDAVLQLDDGEPDDPIPPPPDAANAVTRKGDVWVLDDHRIACGDCREVAFMKSLMGATQARMVLTDPPYNVAIQGHVSGLGKAQHVEFEMASGEMSSAEFVAFLEAALAVAADACMDGALLYAFMDWRHLPELHAACLGLGLKPMNLCVWAKQNGGMGSLYRSRHELILITKKGKAPHINNVQLGKYGRYRSNVWQYAGMNSFSAERDEALAMHPTVKPVAMIADAIKDVTIVGDIVLDPFLGSGTTLIAAERCHRRCLGAEIDPRYVDVALRRWIALTGLQPALASNGKPFEQVRAERLGAEV